MKGYTIVQSRNEQGKQIFKIYKNGKSVKQFAVLAAAYAWIETR